ncbi:MAG: hypothetical protein V3V20_10670 [Algisphaera sp.]
MTQQNSKKTPSKFLSEVNQDDGLAGLVGSAVAGLVLALGFVAMMARVGGPSPVEAAVTVNSSVMVVNPALAVPSLYVDETGAH